MADEVQKKITAAEARKLTGSVYLDRNEAAEFMGVSPKWLAAHTYDGPPYLKIGGKVVYRLASIENWMKQQEVRKR